MPSLIFTILLLIVSIIFSVQNAAGIPIKFLLWEFEWPLSLVILLFFAIGLVTGLLAIVPRLIKNKRALSKERQKLIAQNKEVQKPPQNISGT